MHPNRELHIELTLTVDGEDEPLHPFASQTLSDSLRIIVRTVEPHFIRLVDMNISIVIGIELTERDCLAWLSLKAFKIRRGISLETFGLVVADEIVSIMVKRGRAAT
jgi:hypothetical protein